MQLPAQDSAEVLKLRNELQRYRVHAQAQNLEIQRLRAQLGASAGTAARAEAFAAQLELLLRERDALRDSLAGSGERERALRKELEAARNDLSAQKKRSVPEAERAPSDFKWADTRLPPHAA